MGRDLDLTSGQVSENLLYAADKSTAPMSIAMRPEAARNWFGVEPPDLSVISRARGPDWLYSYLTTFYADSNPSRPFGVNNVVFEDVGMPHALVPLQGLQTYVQAEAPQEAERSARTRPRRGRRRHPRSQERDDAGRESRAGGGQVDGDRARRAAPGRVSQGDAGSRELPRLTPASRHRSSVRPSDSGSSCFWSCLR